MQSLRFRRLAWIFLGAVCWLWSHDTFAGGLWQFVDKNGVVHIGNAGVDGQQAVQWIYPPPSHVPGKPSGTEGNAASVKEHLIQAAAVHAVEPELVLAVASVESALNARAVSKKGALGLMQVMPSTAERYGYAMGGGTAQQTLMFDAQTNAGIGSRYLADLLKMFDGDKELALAAYNAGEGAVMRYGRRIPPYAETRQYVTRVMQRYQAMLKAKSAG